VTVFKQDAMGRIHAVLRASLFGPRASENVDDWRSTAADLRDDELLWIDIGDPSEDELAALAETFEVPEDWSLRPSEEHGAARLLNDHDRMHLSVYAPSGSPERPRLAELICVAGRNWVVTLHAEDVETIEEFREHATGGGGVGVLDAPTFVATLLDWVVTGYVRAFEQVEAELEELDAQAMAQPPSDAQAVLGRLVTLRRTIGHLRRALAPHRELVTALAHPELDALSTEESGRRFAQLEGRLDAAVAAARDAKDSVIGSFDVVIARTEFRTNEIVKVLTLVTVMLLPASVLGGIMGMNFRVGLFAHAWLFWVVVAAMVVVAATLATIARRRNWI
jgi:Mg2+ and Co2+ transporter CorA